MVLFGYVSSEDSYFLKVIGIILSIHVLLDFKKLDMNYNE